MTLNELLDKLSQASDTTSIDDRKYDDIDKLIKEQELVKLQLENDARKVENESESQNKQQRKDFAERIYSFAVIYMFGVFIILFLSGTETTNFKLSDNVLITLLGTTTANVIGILIIVVTYLFSRKKK